MLTRETFRGVWAGLPVAWNDAGEFDEAVYRENVARCCQAGAAGVYCGGTSGEFYAMEFEEYREVARATTDECHACGLPAMVGCTATSTRGAVRRARMAADLQADAVQVAFPFWMDIGESNVIPFLKDVAAAAGGLPLSLYETPRARRVLTLPQHAALHRAVPQYLMVKSTAGTPGATPDGCRELSEFVNVFAGESTWSELAKYGIAGACSSMIYWNPRITLALWNAVETGNDDAVRRLSEPIRRLFEFLHAEFAPAGFTDTAFDRLGGAATGFLQGNLASRGPYVSATPADVETLRNWCAREFPEFLDLPDERVRREFPNSAPGS